jgi:hypothetical protein
MSVNLEISFNINFITNSSYTKFLGLTVDNTLSWNNYIDMLTKKLSTACYKIRNAKTYMFALSLKVIYYALFHLTMSCGITFWGNLSHSSIIFRIQKRPIRVMEGCGNWVSCRNLCKKLQVLPLTSQCMLFLFMFVVQNKIFLNEQWKSQYKH